MPEIQKLVAVSKVQQPGTDSVEARLIVGWGHRACLIMSESVIRS